MRNQVHCGQGLIKVDLHALFCCRYSMFNSPLPNMRQATAFYHTELRCVVILVSGCCQQWAAFG
jgi:hypothetical protein